MYYRRTRRVDVPLITSIQLLPATAPEPPPSSPAHTWTRIARSVRDGVVGTPPIHLWYELGPRLRDLSTDDKRNLITELDILYGDGSPWYGFEKLEGPPTMDAGSGPGRVNVWLTYRRGVKRA